MKMEQRKQGDSGEKYWKMSKYVSIKTTKILINDTLVDEDILKRKQKEINQYFQNECIFIQLNEINVAR